MKASLTWRLHQRGEWLTVSLTLPAESASRVACTILREFIGRSFTPADTSVIGDVSRFSYRSDGMTLAIRRLGKE